MEPLPEELEAKLNEMFGKMDFDGVRAPYGRGEAVLGRCVPRTRPAPVCRVWRARAEWQDRQG